MGWIARQFAVWKHASILELIKNEFDTRAREYLTSQRLALYDRRRLSELARAWLDRGCLSYLDAIRIYDHMIRVEPGLDKDALRISSRTVESLVWEAFENGLQYVYFLEWAWRNDYGVDRVGADLRLKALKQPGFCFFAAIPDSESWDDAVVYFIRTIHEWRVRTSRKFADREEEASYHKFAVSMSNYSSRLINLYLPSDEDLRRKQLWMREGRIARTVWIELTILEPKLPVVVCFGEGISGIDPFPAEVTRGCSFGLDEWHTFVRKREYERRVRKVVASQMFHILPALAPVRKA